MTAKEQLEMALNVRVQVRGVDGEIKTDRRFKNTATKRMTDGIALFLAGDGTVEHKGSWRPNYMSFGTTGILKQPQTVEGLAVVEEQFEDPNPPEGQRTRPWFFSTYLGERCPIEDYAVNQGCWFPSLGWDAPSSSLPGREGYTFQGELVTQNENNATNLIIRRAPILRAEVSLDHAYERDISPEGYSSDCIFYGYASVKWVKYFFEPPNGPSVPKIGISEFGLFEKDSFPKSGLRTMMAGFRVPKEEDIVYVLPDDVMLVEWRVSIRAVMPYEGIAVTTEPAPTGISVNATVADQVDPGYSGAVNLQAVVVGQTGVRDIVSWQLEGADPAYPGTHLEITGTQAKLFLEEGDHTTVLYVTASSGVDPNVHARTAIITGMITNIVTGLAVSMISGSAIDRDYIFLATVLGIGEGYSTDVTWQLESDVPHSQETTLLPDPEYPDDSRRRVLHVAQNEVAREFRLVATSVSNDEIQSVAAVIQIDVTQGSYVVTDFSILTE